MPKRVIDIYFDVQKNALIDSGSSSTLKSRLRPYLIYREQPLLNLHIVDGDAAIPYTGFDGTESFICAVDDDFDHASTVLVRTVNSGINVGGDWYGNEDSSGGDSSAALAADPTQGEISVQINADTAEYTAAVGTSEKISGWMELKAYSGAELIFVLRFAITCENILDDDGATPGTVGSSGAGTSAIASGVSEHTVSGLGLAYIPSTILVSVNKPSGGYNIFATLDEDSKTTDGFTVALSGVTDSANYTLSYIYYQ